MSDESNNHVTPTFIREVEWPYKYAVVISDLHLGVRNASEQWLENIKGFFYNWFIPDVLKPLVKTYGKDGVCLFVLGDVFDDRKNINIEVNETAISIFEGLSNVINVYAITGNHDLYKKTNVGATSLRSLSNIPGVVIYKEPTLIKIAKNKGAGWEAQHIAVPYLGDIAEENRVVTTHSGKCVSAFLHTDIAKMSYDNGRSIMSGVSPDAFKGHIWSGHIHKRQENKNVTYIGSPYQLTRSDIGNEKGVYVVNLYTGEKETFIPNTYSPMFLQVPIETYMGMTEDQRRTLLNDNYIDITIPESSLGKYDLNEIYEFSATTETKKVTVMVNRTEQDNKLLESVNVDSEEEISESDRGVERLIELSIESLDVCDEDKDELKKMSASYMKAARQEHADSII